MGRKEHEFFPNSLSVLGRNVTVTPALTCFVLREPHRLGDPRTVGFCIEWGKEARDLPLACLPLCSHGCQAPSLAFSHSGTVEVPILPAALVLFISEHKHITHFPAEEKETTHIHKRYPGGLRSVSATSCANQWLSLGWWP